MAFQYGVAPDEGVHTTLSMFEDYPAQMGRASKKEIKGIKKTARTLAETSPSDAISYLASQRGYTNFRPDTLLGRIMSRPVDYEKFRSIGSSSFQDLLSREMNEGDWSNLTSQAKALGIKDPSAFQSFLNERIASSPEGSRKILTEADREFESTRGPIARDPEGNLIRGFFYYNPETVRSITNSMLGMS